MDCILFKCKLCLFLDFLVYKYIYIYILLGMGGQNDKVLLKNFGVGGEAPLGPHDTSPLTRC